MKNEWHLFAEASRLLVAGETLVTFYLELPRQRPADGGYGLAFDEAGEEYSLGPEYPTQLRDFLRREQTSCNIDYSTRTLKIGPALNQASPRPPKPGTTQVDLLDPDVDLSQYFGSQDDSDEGEEWKSLL